MCLAICTENLVSQAFFLEGIQTRNALGGAQDEAPEDCGHHCEMHIEMVSKESTFKS